MLARPESICPRDLREEFGPHFFVEHFALETPIHFGITLSSASRPLVRKVQECTTTLRRYGKGSRLIEAYVSSPVPDRLSFRLESQPGIERRALLK
jgi:hypothetical protein